MIPDKEEDIKPRFHKSKVHSMHNDAQQQQVNADIRTFTSLWFTLL